MAPPLEELKKVRLQKLAQIIKLGIDPYPAQSLRKQTVNQTLKMLGKKVAVAGRIRAIRGHGGIQFFDLTDESGKIQLVFKKDELSAISSKLLALLDLGDFIAAQGKVFKTIAGEISVAVEDFQLLTKALRPLPSEWHGLKDIEERFRKRYLDLLLNPEVKKRFILRFQLIRAIQQYLDRQGFIEVETPVLQNLYGGTNAKPFITHLNALNQEMYLRVADELYLKRLVVGGFDKVYEIAKDFRNEGLDLVHNPEFTMIEYYEAYADYHRIMELTEGLYKYIAKKLYGKEEIKVQGKNINLSGQWPKITMVDIIRQKLNLDVQKASTADLLKFARNYKLEATGKENKGELIYVIFDHLIPDYLIQPTWIIDYPAQVSPLSKAHSDNPDFVQRFEGYIGGKEICDGWSEINDPQDQRARFEGEQKAQKEGHHADAHPVDEDFITALEYGMPPLGGIGIGIDRLTMFFTDTWSIKEVILFPTMRRLGGLLPDISTQKASAILPEIKTIEQKIPKSLGITRTKAIDLLRKYLKEEKEFNHLYATEAAMDYYAKKFGGKIEAWKLVGLLHDLDWDFVDGDMQKHGKVAADILRKKGVCEPIVYAILAHVGYSEYPRKSKMDSALWGSEELTGLILALAKGRPDKKVENVTKETISRAYRNQNFASGINRKVIKQGAEELGISLEEHINNVLEAMKTIKYSL
jgi:lysyl-tRNA synthetase class 2